MIKECELVVIGAGPGGYTAAFYAADLGISTLLVERYDSLGGVCLNVGCIPSKMLLHSAALKEEAEEAAAYGLNFSKAQLDLKKLVAHKKKIIDKLSSGVRQLSRARKVDIVRGKASFSDANNLIVKDGKEEHRIVFQTAIIAAGSRPIFPSSMGKKSERIMSSTGALNLKNIPKKMLIIGGGIIGLELGFVYAQFGSKISVVEALDKLAPGVDRDIFNPLYKKIKKLFAEIKLNTVIENLEEEASMVKATMRPVGNKDASPETLEFDKVLVCIGRRPNSDLLAVEKTGLALDEKNHIIVDGQMRSSVANIFAIGDIVGQPMLAHKASKEARVAVDAIKGKRSLYDVRAMPNVIYTDPELAWTGLSEDEAKAQSIDYKKAIFPWAASGRATAISRNDGLTKIIYDAKTERILGVGICGKNAGELIAEAVLAIEMGAVVEDISETVHAHPTLSETFFEAAEAAHNLSTHYYTKRR